MEELIRSKARGLKESMGKFWSKVKDFDLKDASVGKFTDLIARQMKDLSFDRVNKDKAGNLIGVIKGYQDKAPLVMISHLDLQRTGPEKSAESGKPQAAGFKPGIVSSVYAGALLKRALIPMTGDLFICCVPRFESCDSGIKYLFDDYLKTRLAKIRGVVLCEPTDFNINLGHKGRMEYEIIVKGRLNRNFIENRGMNMLGTMFPLISELERVSRELPSDFNLGRSGLRIKDVRYSGYHPQDQVNEFRIVVDRAFIPEESQGFILNKAKSIAKSVYKEEPDVMVNTSLATDRVKTYTGFELISKKELKPWIMESHQPFALESLKSLTENGFKSNFGYWKKITTEGSYTHGQLKIPTIGFGAGEEPGLGAEASINADKIERAFFGLSLIVQRNIGMPAFGWSSDEI